MNFSQPFVLLLYALLSFKAFSGEQVVDPPQMILKLVMDNSRLKGEFTLGSSIAADLTFYYVVENEKFYKGYLEDGFGDLYRFSIDLEKLLFSCEPIVQKIGRTTPYISGEKILKLSDDEFSEFKWIALWQNK